MSRYSYAARDMDGALVNGVMDASDERDVRTRLRQRGFYATSIKIAQEWHRLKRGGKIKSEEIAIFAEQLSVMIDAGLHLVKCLTTLSEQSRNERFGQVIESIRRDVENGTSLGDALAKHPKVFSCLFVSLVQAGEMGGILDKVLRQLADYLDKEQQTKQKIKVALAYPKIVVVVCLATAVFMLSFVVPRFSNAYDKLGLQLPLPTLILIKMSDFIMDFWWVIPIPIIAAAIAYKRFSASKSGREILDKIKLHIPAFGDLNRKISVARFVRVLGALDMSGVPIMQSLEMAGQIVENVVMSRVIEGIRTNVKAGGNLEEPISASKMFPNMVVQMLAAGEQAGKLGESLEKSADYLERELDATIKHLIAKVEPTLTILMAAIVGLFAVAIYLPMFDIVKVINR